MAKKRKAPAEQSGPNLDVGDSRRRIRDFADVADSDDEFHIARDEVLLGEEPEAKRRRKLREREEFLEVSDEEVLGYSEEEDDDEAEEEDDVKAGNGRVASASEESDGEVGDEDGEGFDWGTSKADLYGADDIETEEQALEEEAEALRLQKKQLQSMTAADYGFDADEWQGAGGRDDEAGRKDNAATVVTEVLPELQVADDMGPAERLKLLKSRYPEFQPLSEEILRIRDIHAELAEAARSSADLPANARTKFRAASAYLGALAMYFALLSSPAHDGQAAVTAMSAHRLRDHAVMDSLVKCRELWARAEMLPVDAQETEAESHKANGVTAAADVQTRKAETRNHVVQKSRAQRHAEAAREAAEARRAERMQRTETDLANLDALIGSSTFKKSKAKPQNAAGADGDSDIGEEAALAPHEAAERARRKKSLRFYTSQIAQKANKRGAAGRNAGGDDDIPHRERLRDRQARLNAEAEKRGRRDTAAGAELGGDSEEEDTRLAQRMRAEAGAGAGAGDDDDDYYDLVASRTARKKADKAGLAETQRQAALLGGRVVQEETTGADGKRKISYAIEKNKGLTPHRKKEVRNPRVKKRKKFDEKKKKLASIKPVYKGGEGRGGYGGELTGIKKGLVKSTKL